MMDYAYPIYRSAARSHVRKLQLLQSKCLRIATNSPWYVSNRQIHEDLGIPFLADHTRALTESFDSKLADAGNPLFRQLGRHLYQRRAVWSQSRLIELFLNRRSSRRNGQCMVIIEKVHSPPIPSHSGTQPKWLPRSRRGLQPNVPNPTE
jgi:hypothetical protein